MKFRETNKCSVLSNQKPQKEQCNDNSAKSKNQPTCKRDFETFSLNFQGVLIFKEYFSYSLQKLFEFQDSVSHSTPKRILVQKAQGNIKTNGWKADLLMRL